MSGRTKILTRHERLIYDLAWEATKIANEGRLVEGQLERMQHQLAQLRREGSRAFLVNSQSFGAERPAREHAIRETARTGQEQVVHDDAGAQIAKYRRRRDGNVIQVLGEGS